MRNIRKKKHSSDKNIKIIKIVFESEIKIFLVDLVMISLKKDSITEAYKKTGKPKTFKITYYCLEEEIF